MATLRASRPGRRADATSPVAELRGVSKRYGATTALDGLDLAFRPGELTAVLGPNGAGKTSAVKLLLGLGRPSSGTVRVFGLEPNDLASRRRVGAMLQVSRVPLASAEIASNLHLAEGTVRNYLSEVLSKLGARNRMEAMRLAREKGWL